MTPQWDESGEAINLEAAILDAVQWLHLMAYQMDKGHLTLQNHGENRERLGAAIRAVEKFIEL